MNPHLEKDVGPLVSRAPVKRNLSSSERINKFKTPGDDRFDFHQAHLFAEIFRVGLAS
jgi:hypothetical protein